MRSVVMRREGWFIPLGTLKLCMLLLVCLMGTSLVRAGEEESWEDSERLAVTLDLGEGVTMQLNRIPAGTFVMGSPPTEQGRGNDERQFSVTISKPFYMGIHQVTQLQYLAVMGTNPSQNPGMNLPVEMVSWNDAVEFCKKLSEKTGRNVRLPTEAEWEYACRAGTVTAFNTGATLTMEQANFDGGRGRVERTSPVGSYAKNAAGLYDMHGNVWEWCSDWYAAYPEGAVVDPKGPDRGRGRVLRGGSWHLTPDFCRSAFRYWSRPVYGDDSIGLGFRVLLELD